MRYHSRRISYDKSHSLDTVLAEVNSTMYFEGGVLVVIPARNAVQTLQPSIEDIPRQIVEQILLVDDCSTDGTPVLARKLGLTVVEHGDSVGYGGNQKTCFEHALEHYADYIAVVHPGNHYNAGAMTAAVELLKQDVCDFVVGSRIRSCREAMSAGLSRSKYTANRIGTAIRNTVFGQNLGEYHGGFKVFRRQLLEMVPFERNCNGPGFDDQFLAQASYFGFRIADRPGVPNQVPDATRRPSVQSITRSARTARTLFEYATARVGLSRSRVFQPR